MTLPKKWITLNVPQSPHPSRIKEIFLRSDPMSTPGITRGGLVHLIERRGEQTIQHDALVLVMKMDPTLAGIRGEMAIDAVFVNALRAPSEDWHDDLMVIRDVVHVSHRDWFDGRACIAYQEARLFAVGEGTGSFGVMPRNISPEVSR